MHPEQQLDEGRKVLDDIKCLGDYKIIKNISNLNVWKSQKHKQYKNYEDTSF